jgi:hypothetical protein
MSQTNARSKP